MINMLGGLVPPFLYALMVMAVALRRENMVSVDIESHAPLQSTDKLIVIANTEKLSRLKGF